MKKERQEMILQLCLTRQISTQQELRRLLEHQGIVITQATLSRDIRDLHLQKRRDAKGRGYYLAPADHPLPQGSAEMLSNAALQTDFAGHIAVVHCRPGTASAVCITLDSLGRDDIVGTIAGDDTVFVLFRTIVQAEQFALSFGAKIAGQSGKE